MKGTETKDQKRAAGGARDEKIAACCGPAEKASCCAPADKAGCCGPAEPAGQCRCR